MSTASPYDYEQRAGQGFSAQAFISGERFRRLDRAGSYYDCTQHDWKKWDFDGRIRRSGPLMNHARNMVESAPVSVPMAVRRPSSPMRVGRAVVNAFTNLLFGEKRWPSIRAHGDLDTQEFCEALNKASGLPIKMIRARNLGGSAGSVGLSWSFHDGQPRVSVHRSKHIFIREWADREDLIPKEVSEVYVYPQEEWDPARKCVVQKLYWYRRDWNPDASITYAPALYEPGKEPAWQTDSEGTHEHKDGYAHFVWVQNTPTDEVDGEPDYEGLYEQMDVIDILSSVLARGAVLNLDPTVVLKMDADIVKRMGVRKGSDNALTVGKDGDAKYMELAGTALTAGVALLESKRKSFLEAAQCVLPDPNELAASGMSSVAMKVVYAPMLAKGEVLREQYGGAAKRLDEQQLASSRRVMGTSVQVPGGEEGEMGEVSLNLPPKTRSEPVVDEMGKPTGEEETILEEQVPGEATSLELEWGPWFAPTPDDQLKTAQTLQAATGGAGVFISAQSATEVMASTYGRVPGDEWRRLVRDKGQKQAELGAAFGGDIGGAVEGQDDLPEGALPRQPQAQPVIGDDGQPIMPPAAPAAPEQPELKVNASDLALVITVNEARRSVGLPPLSTPGGGLDPDGLLTMAEFKVKRADTVAKAANAEQGKLGEPPAADTPKAPPPGMGAPGGKGGPPKPGEKAEGASPPFPPKGTPPKKPPPFGG